MRMDYNSVEFHYFIQCTVSFCHRTLYFQMQCYICKEIGHKAVDCPKSEFFDIQFILEGEAGEEAPKTCYICGSPDHLARECPDSRGERPMTCYICHKPGHKAADCRMRFGALLPHYHQKHSFQFQTQERGVLVGFECVFVSISYKCNKPGHFARDCEGEAVCRNCGQPGHFANDCTNPPLCRNCGQSGHIAKDCTNEAVCRKCGKPGHIARDCRD